MRVQISPNINNTFKPSIFIIIIYLYKKYSPIIEYKTPIINSIAEYGTEDHFKHNLHIIPQQSDSKIKIIESTPPVVSDI